MSSDVTGNLIIGGIFSGEVIIGPLLLDSPEYYTNYITKLEWEGTTGKYEPTLDTKNLIIYPNPASDQITVYVNSNVFSSYEILDHQGRMIRKGSVTAGQENITINLSDLSPGIYLLNVLSESGKMTERIVIY